MNQQPPRRSVLRMLLFALTRKAPEQAKQHVQPPRRPDRRDPDAWHTYWQALGQTWRTEPEIDVKRQEELSKRRAIVPDIKKGIYPFKGMKLSRADVEWLLATHEDGRGPVDWSNEWERQRRGLDLRGADLRNEDLHALPLACLIGGLSVEESMHALQAGQGFDWLIQLEEADLRNTHLEGAKLYDANLENADLFEARLQAANLSGSRLNGAWLDKAHLEAADLSGAWLIAANFDDAYLEGADLSQAHAEGAFCDRAHLENANLLWAYLEKTSLENAFLNNANLQRAHLAGANLQRAHFEGADLRKALFGGESMLDEDMPARELDLARKWFHGPRRRGMEENLDPEELAELVEDFPELLPPADLSGAFFDIATQIEGAIFGESRYGWVKVVDMHWSDAYLMHINWSQISRLGDEREARQKEQSGKKKDISILLDDFAKAVRANRQLAIALGNQGLNENAAHFAYRAQVLQKSMFGFQILRPDAKVKKRIQALGAWLFSWFLFLLAGYGYKPGRSFLAYLLVIGTFAALYLLLDPCLAWYEAIVVSMTAFHGRGFSPSTFSPGDPVSIASAIEAFVGLIIEVTFIATLTRRFFGQ